MSETEYEDTEETRLNNHKQSHISEIDYSYQEYDSDSFERLIDRTNKDNVLIRSKCLKSQKELQTITEAQRNIVKSQENLNQSLSYENSTLQTQLNQKLELIEKIRSLFFSLSVEGVNFGQDPNIEVEELINICGQPPRPRQRPQPLALDPVVIGIKETDPYFKDVQTNDEFLDRCNQLQQDYRKIKRNSAFSSPRKLPSPSKVPKCQPSPIRSRLTKESIESSIHQAKFNQEFLNLLDQKQKILEEIDEMRYNEKELHKKYKSNLESPTKTTIQLKMFNPYTNSYSGFGSQYCSEIAPPSPSKLIID